jgi:hypothetical protein
LFFGVIFSLRKTTREPDGQPIEGHPVFVEGNENDNVGVVLETGRGQKKRGRPRKNKEVLGIDEVVKSC